MDLGPHAMFIWSAYAAVAVILSAIVAWLWFDGRRHKNALDDLGRRGITRGGTQPDGER